MLDVGRLKRDRLDNIEYIFVLQFLKPLGLFSCVIKLRAPQGGHVNHGDHL